MCARRPTATGPSCCHARCGAWQARARCDGPEPASNAGRVVSARNARPPTFRPSWRDRQEWFDKIPQRIWKQHGGHARSRYLAHQGQISEVLLHALRLRDVRVAESRTRLISLEHERADCRRRRPTIVEANAASGGADFRRPGPNRRAPAAGGCNGWAGSVDQIFQERVMLHRNLEDGRQLRQQAEGNTDGQFRARNDPRGRFIMISWPS